MSHEDKPNIEDVARNARSDSAEAMYYIMKMDGQIKELESRLTEYQKLLDGRWFESIKALALLDARLSDLEDRVTENGG